MLNFIYIILKMPYISLKIRNFYHTINMTRTLLKGYIHLLFLFYCLYYHIDLIPMLLSLFFSSLLHIIDFNNLFIEKIIFFLDYFFVIYNCYFVFVDRCSIFILNYLFYGVISFLLFLTISFIIFVNKNFSLFRNLYHIGFVIFLSYYLYILYPNIYSYYIDIKAFYFILLPIMFILLIKVCPYNLNNDYIDMHDIFQFCSVLLSCFILYYY
jgi:hypothetical protein